MPIITRCFLHVGLTGRLLLILILGRARWRLTVVFSFASFASLLLVGSSLLLLLLGSLSFPLVLSSCGFLLLLSPRSVGLLLVGLLLRGSLLLRSFLLLSFGGLLVTIFCCSLEVLSLGVRRSASCLVVRPKRRSCELPQRSLLGELCVTNHQLAVVSGDEANRPPCDPLVVREIAPVRVAGSHVEPLGGVIEREADHLNQMPKRR